jgi:hypothetical protein
VRPVKPKLASGPKSIYTRSRVFVHPSLAADPHRKNPLAYGELVAGRAVYAYVDGNPVSLDDPSGLEALPVPLPLPLYVPAAPPGSPLNNAIYNFLEMEAQGATNLFDWANYLSNRALDNIMLMAKGGKQNISNEYSRLARNQNDPCGWLSEQYDMARKAGDSAAAQKIIQAQKDLGCRNKAKRCP